VIYLPDRLRVEAICGALEPPGGSSRCPIMTPDPVADTPVDIAGIDTEGTS